MRGKRKLSKIEFMSNDSNQVYECDACAWMLNSPLERTLSDIQSEFDSHDCKENSLKRGRVNFRRLNTAPSRYPI